MTRLALFTMTMVIAFSSVTAQKIASDEMDKFSKERRVETKPLPLKPAGLTTNLTAKYRSVGDRYFLILAGNGWGAGTIGRDDDLVFLLENDSTVKIQPTSIQSYEVGQYGNSYRHQYEIYKEQIEQLSKMKTKSLRKYYSTKYADMDIPQKNGNNFVKLSELFLNTLSKQ
jgi:hypothetical protein